MTASAAEPDEPPVAPASASAGSPASGPASAPRRSPWAPLAHRVFLILFIAQFVSNVGTWMQTVGAQWFLVENAHSPALVAWVQTASSLPVLLLSLIAGVWADVADRKRLLLVTSIASGVVAVALAVVAYAGLLDGWLLLGLTFLLGCAAAITSPAWQAIQPELVPRDELPEAASLGTITVNGARAIGPAIAGVIVAATGPALVFALNAVSFLAVTVALLLWKRPPQPAGPRERAWPALRAGVRYVRAAPGVRRILLRCALFAIPASALWALLPSAASSLMHTGAGGYSLLLAVLGVGAVLGVVVLPRLRRRFDRNLLLAASALLFGLDAVSAAWWPLPVTAVLSVVAGLAWMTTLTTLNATMQLTVPAWVRARALATYLLVFMGSQAVGSFVWGALAPAIGLRTALTASAVLLALCAASVRLLPISAVSGTLDRTIVPMSDETPVLLAEELRAAPVAVQAVYRVAPENVAAFTAAMRELGRSRRRTGAIGWRLLQRADAPGLFVEEFTASSWDEHLLQHDVRWTGYDAEVAARAAALAAAPPEIAHLAVADGA